MASTKFTRGQPVGTNLCLLTTVIELSVGTVQGENIVVGGENRWSYSSFVNWEFFPKGWVEQAGHTMAKLCEVVTEGIENFVYCESAGQQ
eukprot:849987-Amphidinium_carterae.1